MKHFIITLILFSLFSEAQAQRLFSEGVITYNVSTDGNKKSIGKYVVLVKGKYIKRVLTLNNGYSNNTIYNGKEGTSATLKTVQGTPYALMLTKEEVNDASQKFAGAVYQFDKKTKKIAGYNAVSGSVIYPNGTKSKIAVTQDLRAEDYHLLTMFPNLNGIPLEYEMKNGTSSMHFIAEKVDIRNVGSEEFTIPKNYKIVTKKELEGK
jgi:hypothetical protein